MFNIKKQIERLYVSSVLGILSLTGAWVAILAARGYSLVEIGIAETVFHITSLALEILSGIFADVFGRKTMLIVSAVMKAAGNIFMIFSGNLFMVCTSIAFYAVSGSFSSGTGDSLAYDSLKMAGKTSYYEKYASNQLVIYRLCSGISTMCAGIAFSIGYQAAYGADILIGALQIGILMKLCEAGVPPYKSVDKKNIVSAVKKELAGCFIQSLFFLGTAKRAVFFMFCNSLVGAVDILLLFFLQAKLFEIGMPKGLLGIALFFMEMGGILGAKIILKCKKTRYRRVFAAATFLVSFGVLLEHTGMYSVMAAGGFIAAFGDDALEVRTNKILQDMFPSEQRATLISMESFIFSVIMIVLSPLAGILFSWW